MKELTPSVIKRINESGSIDILRQKLKINLDQDMFKILLEYLDLIVDKYEGRYKETSYKIIDFLELIATSEISNLMNKCFMLKKEKYKIIDMLKDDNNNFDDREIVTLKELANKLENLEVNISFNINYLSIIENYNIVKHILFKEKNKNLSKHLVENNSYLVEAFNRKNENILIMLTKSYLKAIDDFVLDKDFYDLTYFDELLEQILRNDKISKDEKAIETCIHMVLNYDKNKNKNSSQINKAVHWYKHLEKKLDNPMYEEDKEELNNLYGISPYFKKDVTEEGYILGKEDNTFFRIDKNNEYIITIDNSLGYDKDDALSISKENGLYKLKVYISDPNSFCLKSGLLMEEARRRVETIYNDREKIGIFPKEIVGYYMSLEQSCNRYARCYEFLISETGIIVDFKIKKEIVNVSHNYNYDEFNNALYKSDEPKEYITIQNLLDLRDIINKKYIGADNNTEVTAEKLLETFTLFTNSKIAEYFALSGTPFIYKYHSNSDERFSGLLEKVDENKKYKEMVKEAIRCGNERIYSSAKTSHEGLNLNYYCHATSPLHNYSDILLNECEDMFYFDNPSDKEAYLFEKYLNNEIEYINEKITMLDRYREKYEKAKVRCKSKR